jgi:hypothetical protein
MFGVLSRTWSEWIDKNGDYFIIPWLILIVAAVLINFIRKK